MNYHKNVLVAPLDWGLGHATRCIPVINELLKQGAEVCIAGNGKSLMLLKQEFPQLDNFELPGYNIRYSTANMVGSMIKQAPKIFAAIASEKKIIRKIVQQKKSDIIISDNRYGARNASTKNIFISHQLNIKVPENIPFAKTFIDFVNSQYLSAFDECWIPDTENGIKLSGELSLHKKNTLPIKYVGILSRFNGIQTQKEEYTYPYIAIVSGPEPQRSIFEDKIIEQLFYLNKAALIIRGKPDDRQELKSRGMIDFRNHASAAEIFSMITKETILISRSGYSTIMDLALLGNKAVLIPTPGQTEQEYLAKYLMTGKFFYSQLQKELDLSVALQQVYNYNGLPVTAQNNLLGTAITNILKS